MSESGTINSDPFEMWKQFYEANEQAWTKAMKDVMSTPGYAEAQGKMLEVILSYQKLLREATTAQLANLNLPTREDVSRLGELVINLEEKIDQFDDRLLSVEKAVGERGRDLARVSEQIGKSGTGIDGVATRIGRLEERLGKIDQIDAHLQSVEKSVGEQVGRSGTGIEGVATRLGRLEERLGEIEEAIKRQARVEQAAPPAPVKAAQPAAKKGGKGQG